jgi:2-dehydropantoate 2-reductase
MIGEETSILGLQNGVDAAERIGRILGMEHMIAGATWISSAVEAPGIIHQVSEFQRVVLGELNGEITGRLRAVQGAFKEAGVDAEISENIQGVLWTKFIFLAAASAFGSLTGLPVGGYRSVPETRALITDLMRETESIARRLQVRLEPDVVEKALSFMDRNGPKIKASMQLDVEAGRQTELESIIGVVSRKGRELELATPVADMLYGLLLPIDLAARSRQGPGPSRAVRQEVDSPENDAAEAEVKPGVRHGPPTVSPACDWGWKGWIVRGGPMASRSRGGARR